MRARPRAFFAVGDMTKRSVASRTDRVATTTRTDTLPSAETARSSSSASPEYGDAAVTADQISPAKNDVSTSLVRSGASSGMK